VKPLTGHLRRTELVAVGLLMLLAAVLRFHQLDTIPVGLDVDEAVDGWEARRILNGGCCPIFFTADYGEEPMHIYTVALLFRLLGSSVVYVRAASAIAGLLLVPVIYLLARELFPPVDESLLSVPILSAFWVATSYWHITYSRAGMEPVYLPLFVTASTLFLWRGIKLQKRWLFVLAGCLLGAGLYTYRAVRFFPILLLMFMGYRILRDVRFRQMHLRNLVLFAMSCLIVFLPLGSYALTHPSVFVQREMTVSVLGAASDTRSVAMTIAESAARTFGMYSIVPDPQFERNPAHRPILDPLSSVFFIVGLTAAWLKRKQPAYAFVFLWLVVMSLPGALTPDVSPQYSRGMGALPAVALLFSLGVDSLAERLRRGRLWPRVRRAYRPLLCLALATIALLSYRDYFFPWAERQRQGIVAGARATEAAEVMNTTHVPGGVWILPANAVHASRLPFFQINFLYDGLLPHHTLHVDETSCAYELSETCQGRNTALVVNWTDFIMEKAYESLYSDPKGLIDFLLRKYGRRLEAEPFQSFDLVTYELPESPDFSIARSFQAFDANFGNELSLVGVAFGGSSLSPTSTLQEVERKVLPSGKEGWVVLQWQSIKAPSKNHKVAVYLLDGQGRLVGQVDKLLLSNYLQPTSGWTAGQIEMDYYILPSLPATPPGEYNIQVVVYDPETGERLTVLDELAGVTKTNLAVGTLQMVKPLDPPQVEPMELLPEAERDIAPGIQLLGYDLQRSVVKPGETVSVALYWQALEDVSQDYLLSLSLKDGEGQVWLEQQVRPVDDTYATTEWEEGEVLRDWHDLTLPADMPPGAYGISLGVLEGGQLFGEMALGTTEVTGRPRQFTIPEIQHPMEARLGEAIMFLGYDLISQEVRGNETLELTLYWQLLQEIDTSYTVFTHLLDEEERIWGQMDSFPGGGEAPTISWIEGEVITDEYEIAVDPETPPGDYAVEIGMYDANTGKRLPVYQETEESMRDRILVGDIQVVDRQ